MFPGLAVAHLFPGPVLNETFLQAWATYLYFVSSQGVISSSQVLDPDLLQAMCLILASEGGLVILLQTQYVLCTFVISGNGLSALALPLWRKGWFSFRDSVPPDVASHILDFILINNPA